MGANTQPCFTPLFTSKSLEISPSNCTVPLIPTWKDSLCWGALVDILSEEHTKQAVSAYEVETLGQVYESQIERWFCSLHFSCSWRTEKISLQLTSLSEIHTGIPGISSLRVFPVYVGQCGRIACQQCWVERYHDSCCSRVGPPCSWTAWRCWHPSYLEVLSLLTSIALGACAGAPANLTCHSLRLQLWYHPSRQLSLMAAYHSFGELF